MASWLVRSSPDRVVRVQAMAGDLVLCCRAIHFTLTVPLYTQVKNGYGEFNDVSNSAMD